MVHKEDLLEMFITYDLEDLYGDFSDDGDGKLELTEKGNEVATTLIKLVEQEIEKAREEGVKDGMRGMIDILCEKGCGSMFAVIEEKDVNKKIEELSKLTTK